MPLFWKFPLLPPPSPLIPSPLFFLSWPATLAQVRSHQSHPVPPKQTPSLSPLLCNPPLQSSPSFILLCAAWLLAVWGGTNGAWGKHCHSAWKAQSLEPCRRQPGRPDIRLANGRLTERREDGMERENTRTREDKKDDETPAATWRVGRVKERCRERECGTDKEGERQIERERARERDASMGDGKQSHPLSARPASTLGGRRKREGRKGGREGGRKGVSLSSLHAPILFSGFPFHEEIVASRVTLPFKGEGKRACVFNYKGIHKPPSTHHRFPRQPPWHTPLPSQQDRNSYKTWPTMALCSFVKAPRKVPLLKNRSLMELKL